MANDTTPEAPTPATLRLIEKARRAGLPAEQAVRRFVRATRKALDPFAREVEPLDLDDDAFAALERRSGMWAVLDLAERLSESLGTLSQGA